MENNIKSIFKANFKVNCLCWSMQSAFATNKKNINSSSQKILYIHETKLSPFFIKRSRPTHNRHYMPIWLKTSYCLVYRHLNNIQKSKFANGIGDSLQRSFSVNMVTNSCTLLGFVLFVLIVSRATECFKVICTL